jgi:hypothetical protein
VIAGSVFRDSVVRHSLFRTSPAGCRRTWVEPTSQACCST